MSIQLALGKFTPDHFSHFSKAFSNVEVDLAAYFKWEPRQQKRFRDWIEKKSMGVIPRVSLRTQKSEEEFSDLFVAGMEEFKERLQFFLIASGRKNFDLARDLRMHRALVHAQKQSLAPLFFEWGEEDDLKTMLPVKDTYPGSGMVLDLDVHRSSVKKCEGPIHFKLHGWHPERWMRRYGESLTPKLVKRIPKAGSFILILSHSGRVEEGHSFAKAILDLKG
jgi:hypothetical protein